METNDALRAAARLQDEASQELDAAVAEQQRGQEEVSLELLREAVEKEREAIEIQEQALADQAAALDERRRAFDEQVRRLENMLSGGA